MRWITVRDLYALIRKITRTGDTYEDCLRDIYNAIEAYEKDEVDC